MISGVKEGSTVLYMKYGKGYRKREYTVGVVVSTHGDSFALVLEKPINKETMEYTRNLIVIG